MEQKYAAFGFSSLFRVQPLISSFSVTMIDIFPTLYVNCSPSDRQHNMTKWGMIRREGAQFRKSRNFLVFDSDITVKRTIKVQQS
jgi:hypothetical protein